MKTKFLITSVVLVLLCACGSADYERYGNEPSLKSSANEQTPSSEAAGYSKDVEMEYEESEPMANGIENKKIEKENADFISSVAAMVNQFDTTRKFIRTANLKFRVDDLKKSTYSIEDVIIKFKGFVTYTHLNTDIRYSKKIQISKDSILESTYYTMRNNMTLRVPNQYLDTVIRLIGRHIDYLDYRTIEANDITIDLIAKQLEQKRMARFQKRLGKAIDEKGKKLDDIESAENSMLAKATAEDNAYLENLRTMDLVEYSTINLYLYEREKIFHDLIPNEENIAKYEPSFWSKIGEGFYQGWLILEKLILGLINLWPIIIILVLSVYFAIKKVKSMTKKMYDK